MQALKILEGTITNFRPVDWRKQLRKSVACLPFVEADMDWLKKLLDWFKTANDLRSLMRLEFAGFHPCSGKSV